MLDIDRSVIVPIGEKSEWAEPQACPFVKKTSYSMKKVKKTKLRLYLDARKMSAAQLAAKMDGVSVRTVQAISQGVREPSMETARKIAKALQTKVDIIFS